MIYKLTLLALFFIYALSGYALDEKHWTKEMKALDVILISLPCYACSAIEAETHSEFSHIGIVLQIDEEIVVAHSLGKVHLVSLENFLGLARKKSKMALLRLRPNLMKESLYTDFNYWERKFKLYFQGKPYDLLFEWKEQSPIDAYYCSEFVAKFIDDDLALKSPLGPMTFQKFPEFWNSYFKGQVPEGKLGNSPQSFLTDLRFQLLMYFRKGM